MTFRQLRFLCFDARCDMTVPAFVLHIQYPGVGAYFLREQRQSNVNWTRDPLCCIPPGTGLTGPGGKAPEMGGPWGRWAAGQPGNPLHPSNGSRRETRNLQGQIEFDAGQSRSATPFFDRHASARYAAVWGRYVYGGYSQPWKRHPWTRRVQDNVVSPATERGLP